MALKIWNQAFKYMQWVVSKLTGLKFRGRSDILDGDAFKVHLLLLFLFTRDPLRGVQKRPAYPLKGIQKWPRLLSQRSRCRKTVHQNTNDNKYPEYCKKMQALLKTDKIVEWYSESDSELHKRFKIMLSWQFCTKIGVDTNRKRTLSNWIRKEVKRAAISPGTRPNWEKLSTCRELPESQEEKAFSQTGKTVPKRSCAHHRHSCSFVTLPQPCNPCTRSLWTCERDLCG